MGESTRTKKQLLVEMENLRARLEEVEETLRSIRSGEVDAFVVSGPEGDQVYTLKGAEHPYRVLVEAMNEGAATLMPDGTILYCNGRFAGMVMTPLEEVINSSVYNFVAPEDLPISKALLDQGMKTNGRGEVCLRKADGCLLPVNLSVTPMQVDGTSVVCAVIADLTEQTQAQLESRTHQAELAHVTRVAILGELTASLAHEINQPLAAILNNAKAAQRFLSGNAPDLDEVRGILRDIVRDDKRASEVIRRLRELLRRERTHRDLVHVDEVIRDTLRFVYGDLLVRGVTVATELAHDLPPVLGDRIQLHQVLLNLILNGCDAMMNLEPDARRLEIRTQKQDDQSVRVSVRDFGIGLDRNQLARLFEPFYTTKPEGLGMGLSISRSIIEAHGGLLWAASNPEQGATFHFEVPIEHGDVP